MMKSTTKLLLMLAFWLIGFPVYGFAEEMADGQWLSRYRDHLSSVSTPVRLSDTLNVLWERPAGGWVHGPPANSAIPLVHNGMVISGNCVYDAWSGDLIHYFPDAGNRVAITDNVFLTARPRNYLQPSDYELFAYDLNTFELLWYLDPLAAGSPITVSYNVYITGRGDTFYVVGGDRVAAICARPSTPLTPDAKWERIIPGGSRGRTPCVADVLLGGSLVEVVYVGCWISEGLLAMRASNGQKVWFDGEFSTSPPSVDPIEGLVYSDVGWVTSDTGGSVSRVRARDAASGVCVWEEEIDKILNGPLTLGEVFNSTTGVTKPAVFAVTGGGDQVTSVYAFDRRRATPPDGSRLLWRTEVPTPSDTYTSATYSGGKLYFADHDGRTYELDADTGALRNVWETSTGWAGSQATPRVIVEVLDESGSPQSVMYYLNSDGDIVALTQNASTSLPEAFLLLVEAIPAEISTNSSTMIFAELLYGDLRPVDNARVAFSCDAGNNQGYLDPTFAYTGDFGEPGVAATMFFSENRAGVVTIAAEVVGINASATTAVTIVKGGGEEPPPPPPETGAIAGTVYDALDDPVKGATVTATSQTTGESKKSRSNKWGLYTIVDLPEGLYTVEGYERVAGSATVPDVEVFGGVTTPLDLGLEPAVATMILILKPAKAQ